MRDRYVKTVEDEAAPQATCAPPWSQTVSHMLCVNMLLHGVEDASFSGTTTPWPAPM
jgi:hypothetical protein